MSYCLNKKCKEQIVMSRDWFCPSCKFIGRTGMFIGGLLTGIVFAVLKWLRVI